MKVETLPKEEQKELTEKQKENLFTSIVLGKDVTETIETSRGKFKIKYPRMRDIEEIGRRTAFRLNSLPAMSFDAGIYNLIQKIATLDTLVISGEGWYENAKKEANFTWGAIPIQSFIEEVYSKVAEFRFKVQELLERDNDTANREVAAEENSNVSSDAGLFEGMSGGE